MLARPRRLDTPSPRILVNLAALTLVGLAPPALASERVLVLVDERVADGRADTPLAETRLVEHLIAAGAQVVEAVETERARRAVSIDRLLGGAIGGEVTALETDLLIVGRTTTVAEEIPYGVTDVSAVSTEWTLRVVAVDTGRVVASASGRVGGAGTQAQAAAADARRKAADAMFDATRGALRGSPADTISLTVTGLQELAEVERLRQRLVRLPGVRGARVRFVSAEARLDVEVDGLDAWTLGALLGQVGLEVAEASRGALRAAWAPWGTGKPLLVLAFANHTGRDAHDWIEALLPQVFETELANSRYLRPLATAARPGFDPTSPQAGVAAARAAGAELIVAGALEQTGDRLRLAVTVLDAAGKQLAAAQVFSGDADLVGRTRELVWEVDERLFRRLFQRGALAPYRPAFSGRAAATADAEAPARPAEAPADRAVVQVAEVTLDDLYPARLGAYATRPVGRLVLTNPSARPATGVRVTVDLPGFVTAPTVLRVADLGPDAVVEVPLTLALDRDRVLAVRENTPAQATVAIAWDASAPGRGDGSDRFTVPTIVFDRGALDWSLPESVAAFVTPRDPQLDRLARAVAARSERPLAGVAEALRGPLGLFEALGALGIRYQTDARNPFGATRLDAVAFPAETLGRRAGDCDDLSVLYAALLESQGTPTAFVLTPGHVLVAFDTGVAVRAAERLGLATEDWFERGGRAWAAVEVTRVGRPFAEAIAAGATELRRHRDVAGGLTFVDLAEAWRAFPPFPGELPAADLGAYATALDARLAASGEALAARGADARIAALEAPERLEDPDALNRAGVLLVERGQWRRAGAYLERAEARSGGRPDIRYNLANLRVVAGRRPEARQIYAALGDETGLASHSAYGLGVVAYLDGDPRGARAAFARSGLPEAREAQRRLGLDAAPAPRRARPGAPPPPPDPFAGVRAGADRVPLDELLLWLR